MVNMGNLCHTISQLGDRVGWDMLKLIWRNLRARMVRSLLTMAGILLGVAAMLAVQVTNATTLSSIRVLFEEAAGKADLVVESSDIGSGGFDEGVLARLRATDGVKLAAPSVRVETFLVKNLARWQMPIAMAGIGKGGLLLVGVDPDIDPQVRSYHLRRGQFLSSKERKHSMVLGEDFAREEKIELGEWVEVLAPGGKEAFQVVGLMSPEGLGRLNGGAVGVVALQVAQEVFERGRKIDQVEVVAVERIARSTSLMAKLKEKLEERLGKRFSVVYPAARGKVVNEILATYQTGLNFLSIVALFVGIFLIYNVFSMTVAERTREIGMLRALGMTRRQVMKLIVAESSLLGGIGSALGIVAGLGLARALVRSFASFSGVPPMSLEVKVAQLVHSFWVGIAVAILSALIPAWRASCISPLEALRARSRAEGGPFLAHSWLVGLALILPAWAVIYVLPLRQEMRYPLGATSVFILLLGASLCVPITVRALEAAFRPPIAWLYGAEGALGSRNVRRSLARTTLTVAALMIGIAMVIGIKGMTEAFRVNILEWVETAIGGDLYARSPIPMRAEFGARLLAIEGVEAISPMSSFWVRPVGDFGDIDRLLFIARDPDSHLQVASFQFASGQGDKEAMYRRLAGGDAIFISTVLRDRLGLDQGDILHLETERGLRPFHIAGVVVDFVNEGYVIDGSWLDMKRYFGRAGVDSFVLKLRKGASQEAVRREIERLYGEARHLRVESSQEFKARVMKLAGQAFSLLDVLGFIGVIVAALGVINTLMMNVLERQREIGMLRSLGMTRRQVARMILAEAGTMAGAGGLFGLGYGVLLSRVFIMAANFLGGYVMQYVLPLQALGIGVVLALGVSQVAAAYPAWRAARVVIVEAIQTE